MLTGLSMTRTLLAPAWRASVTSAATTLGLVVTAYLGWRGWEMLGLITTTSPELTNFFMPPTAATARLTFELAEVPLAMARMVPDSRAACASP